MNEPNAWWAHLGRSGLSGPVSARGLLPGGVLEPGPGATGGTEPLLTGNQDQVEPQKTPSFYVGGETS